MTCHEDPDAAALDSYIRIQLCRAADTYASLIDMSARLDTLIREAESRKKDSDGAAVADG